MEDKSVVLEGNDELEGVPHRGKDGVPGEHGEPGEDGEIGPVPHHQLEENEAEEPEREGGPTGNQSASELAFSHAHNQLTDEIN